MVCKHLVLPRQQPPNLDGPEVAVVTRPLMDVRLGRSVLRVNRPVADHGGEGSAIIAIHSQGRLGILRLHLDVSSSSWKKIFGVKVKPQICERQLKWSKYWRNVGLFTIMLGCLSR